MASGKQMKAPEKADLDNWIDRTSLFDVAFDRAKTYNLKAMTHRMIWLSKINSEITDRAEIGEYFEKYLKTACSNYLQPDSITGLLLLYQQYAIYIIESYDNILIDITKELDLLDQQRIFFISTKLVAYQSNIMKRLFPSWGHCVVDLPLLRLDEQKSTESKETIVSDIISSVYTLSIQVRKQTKSRAKSASEEKTIEQYASHLIPPDIMEKFMKIDNTLSPKQYYDKYLSPKTVTLTRELVWPINNTMYVL